MKTRERVCAVCSKPIAVSRFQDMTAAGQVTRVYRAWCPVGELHRGQDRPRPHWCHPDGGDPTGEA